SFNFPYKIDVGHSKQGQWKMHYWFSTEYGVYPAKATKMEKDPHKAIEKNYLGKIDVIAEE
ncbi:MAG: hypothetical protein NUV96_01895, partial [Candidatus Colwellbacteria bacterium]|nr:hypothetical protein [Candidatus Colwellbacteria bacterium]